MVRLKVEKMVGEEGDFIALLMGNGLDIESGGLPDAILGVALDCFLYLPGEVIDLNQLEGEDNEDSGGGGGD